MRRWCPDIPCQNVGFPAPAPQFPRGGQRWMIQVIRYFSREQQGEAAVGGARSDTGHNTQLNRSFQLLLSVDMETNQLIFSQVLT